MHLLWYHIVVYCILYLIMLHNTWYCYGISCIRILFIWDHLLFWGEPSITMVANSISCGIVVYAIMNVYRIVLNIILGHVENYIIWIWHTRGYHLLRYFMYIMSYGIVIGSFITISWYGMYFASGMGCIVLHLVWDVFCILYDIAMARHWLSFIEISWYVTW